MVAVLTVFACHLWGQPRGGFVGVDVFFVISGFLITGNLLRMAETHGNVSFKKFYWNRVRRIVPAATVVLALTYLASAAVFLPFRTHQIGIDAVAAFFFLSNWRFAVEGTDYFAAAAETVSPIQHYWSLSIEEQFYFVWPALIFVIGVLILRKAWTHQRRMAMAGIVMAAIVAVSFAWALYETVTSPTWAYFNTFSRVWELGTGALLAIASGTLARIPHRVRPLLSWSGLVLITVSVILIAEGSTAFPAPWALLPVAGASLVIAAGTGKEPTHQAFLRNPASTYIGDISYSLYLVHWPVVVILGSVIHPGLLFSMAAVTLSFALAIASYHFVESPLRRADKITIRTAARRIRTFDLRPSRTGQGAALASVGLLVVALCAYSLQPVVRHQLPSAEDVASAGVTPTARDALPAAIPGGTLTVQLQTEIQAALHVTDWPMLDPSMEAVISGPEAAPEVSQCGAIAAPVAECTWGSGSATTRIVLVGDSIALSYAGALRELALNSGGRVQVTAMPLPGCMFVDDLIDNDDRDLVEACPGRKQQQIDLINSTHPDVVLISNSYTRKEFFATHKTVAPFPWRDSMSRIVDKFRSNVGKVVFLSPPPASVNIAECYGTRANTPADCTSKVTQQWSSMASVELELAKTVGGAWIDSRPWFCSDRLCPSFVASLPTKHDLVHMSPAYGIKIYPMINESLAAAGVL